MLELDSMVRRTVREVVAHAKHSTPKAPNKSSLQTVRKMRKARNRRQMSLLSIKLLKNTIIPLYDDIFFFGFRHMKEKYVVLK